MKSYGGVLVIALLTLWTVELAVSAPSGYSENALVVKGLTYSTVGGVDLKLDLARPALGNGPFPAIVYVHGGGFGWSPQLGRSDYSAAISSAAEKGYVAITIDLRSIAETQNGKTKYPFPCQLSDAKCAIRWLRANADTYKVDSSRIGIVGYSSGGYLALLLGMTKATDGLEGAEGYAQYSSEVQAVVSCAGTDDMEISNEDDPYYVALFGGKRSELPQLYEKAKPFKYIRKGNPPILSIQGDLDDEMPLSLSQELDNRCKATGAPHRLIVIKGAGHVEAMSMWNDKRVWDFLKRNLSRKSILNVIGIYFL